MYGSQIGRKFDADGTALRYPGNTVIADVCPGCGAYDVMTRLKRVVSRARLDRSLILLPEDSYHMTVIRGLNDRVRERAFWPGTLPADSAMTRVDDYFEAAVRSVPPIGGLAMRFTGVQITAEDFRVLVAPADDAQAAALRRYRDNVADALGLRLPGHDAYAYHITLAYMRIVPEGDNALDGLIAEMNGILENAAVFKTNAPYAAFYEDMLRFYHHRLPRGTEGFAN